LNLTDNNFGEVTLGDVSAGPIALIVGNHATVTDTINLSTDLFFSGRGADDYIVLPSSNCPGDGVNLVILPAGNFCTLLVTFVPGALGDRSATLTLQGLYDTSASVGVDGTGTIGYYEVSSAGKVAAFGDAGLFGDASKVPLGHPIVGMAATGDDGGYWLVASDGGIFSFGDAQFYGSTGAIRLNKPIVGMAATPDAGGYWMVASDGGIFSFGDAQFYGSTGAIHLNKPIVGMASTPDGAGYWLVASDGGIFSFGDAQFYGSTGAIHLNQPIVGMAAMPDGLGYWFAAADGGLFNYGDAPFQGAATGLIGNVVAIATDGAPTLQASAGLPAVRHSSIRIQNRSKHSGL
jgi:TM2 domain-containing membrane protein YozV